LRPNAEPLPPVDDNKDVDEDQLVIDFDKKSKDKTISNNSGKRSAKRQKSHTNGMCFSITILCICCEIKTLNV